jgi:hypothetical protein
VHEILGVGHDAVVAVAQEEDGLPVEAVAVEQGAEERAVAGSGFSVSL